MTQFVGRRWISSLFDSTRVDARDAAEVAQWDQIARRLRTTEAGTVRSSATHGFGHRQRVPLGPGTLTGPGRIEGLGFAQSTLRKDVLVANLGRLKRELESEAARGSEAFVLAIAV